MKFETQTGYTVDVGYFKRGTVTLTFKGTHPLDRTGYGVPLTEKDFGELIARMAKHPEAKDWAIIEKLEAD